MLPGLPKSYIKKYGISKRAWREYRKAVPKRGTGLKTGRAGKRRRGKPRTEAQRRARHNPKKVKRVARRRSYSRKRRRRGVKTIPILPLVGLAAGLWEPVTNIVNDPSPETIKQSLNHMVTIYSGFNAIDGEFQPQMLLKGLAPLVGGILAHKIVTSLGGNRAFANLPSPLNKLRL